MTDADTERIIEQLKRIADAIESIANRGLPR